MLIIIGLLVLTVALIVGSVGVITNAGSAHLVTDDFAVFNYHVTGSTGTVFLYGILIGAVGLAGLSLVLAGAIRASERSRAARNELKSTRQEAELIDRDRDRLLKHQHDGRGVDDAVSSRDRRTTSSARRWWGRRDTPDHEPAELPRTS